MNELKILNEIVFDFQVNEFTDEVFFFHDSQECYITGSLRKKRDLFFCECWLEEEEIQLSVSQENFIYNKLLTFSKENTGIN